MAMAGAQQLLPMCVHTLPEEEATRLSSVPAACTALVLGA